MVTSALACLFDKLSRDMYGYVFKEIFSSFAEFSFSIVTDSVSDSDVFATNMGNVNIGFYVLSLIIKGIYQDWLFETLDRCVCDFDFWFCR